MVLACSGGIKGLGATVWWSQDSITKWGVVIKKRYLKVAIVGGGEEGEGEGVPRTLCDVSQNCHAKWFENGKSQREKHSSLTQVKVTIA